MVLLAMTVDKVSIVQLPTAESCYHTHFKAGILCFEIDTHSSYFTKLPKRIWKIKIQNAK